MTREVQVHKYSVASSLPSRPLSAGSALLSLSSQHSPFAVSQATQLCTVATSPEFTLPLSESPD